MEVAAGTQLIGRLLKASAWSLGRSLARYVHGLWA
jgi:hypothetical protein